MPASDKLVEIWKGVSKTNNRGCIAKPTPHFRKSPIALVVRHICLLFCLIPFTLCSGADRFSKRGRNHTVKVNEGLIPSYWICIILCFCNCYSVR